MQSHLDYKAAFKSLAKEFNDTLGISIERTKEVKKDGRVEKIERSRIIQRLEHMCVKDEKISEIREYHLCQFIQHSFRSINPSSIGLDDAKRQERTTKKMLTRNLLSEDCVLEMMPLVAIMEDDEGIFDLRKKALKESLTEAYLNAKIKELFEINDQNYVFKKRPEEQQDVLPVHGSSIVPIGHQFDTTAIIHYVTLCHTLEKNPSLLDIPLWKISDRPERLVKYLLQNREIFEALKRIASHRLNHLITVDVVLNILVKEESESVKNMIRLLLDNHYFNDAEWLKIISDDKHSIDIRAFIVTNYIEQGIKQHGALENWLQSVDSALQRDVLNILEAEHIPINYLALYSTCVSLRELPKVQLAYAEHKNKALSQLRVRNIFSEVDEKQVETYKKCFNKAMVDAHLLDAKLVERVKKELADYKEKYLNVDAKGVATASLFTAHDRADAYNAIAHLLEKKAINLDRLVGQLLNLELIGEEILTGRRPLAFLRPLINWANHYVAYQKTREDICKQVKNNDGLLLELLLDVDMLDNLTAEELQLVFEYGNKGLFAEIIVRGYPGVLKEFYWRQHKVDAEFLKSLVPMTDGAVDLDGVNHLRARLGIPQYVPVGAKYPGINPSDAALDKAALYQLQDPDIAVGEGILLEEFKNTLSLVEICEPVGIPKFIKLHDQRAERKIEVADQKLVKTKMYLVPMNAAQSVLIDPAIDVHPHRRTYRVFEHNIHLILSKVPRDGAHLLVGIANLNANHYVPYFIHRNEDDRITVFTVDPSYQTSPLLEKCFKSIFPGCIYMDANIVQQVRQRDCGFNSLQVIADVVQSMATAAPVLAIEKGVARFNPERLTINGSAYRRRDYARGEDYFLKEFILQAELNRQRWAAKLQQKRSVRYSSEAELDYDYVFNVDHQEAQDVFDEKLSIITALMIGQGNSLEKFRAQYKNNLLLPTLKQLEEIRNELIAHDDITPEISDLLEGQAGVETINTVCKINFKQDTAIGLMNFYTRHFLPRCVLNKDSTPESIVWLFTETQKYVEFSKLLSERELAVFRTQAIGPATERVTKEIVQLKARFVHDHIKENIENYLQQTEVDAVRFIDELIKVLQGNVKLAADMAVLLKNPRSRDDLIACIQREIKQCIDRHVARYSLLISQQPTLLQKEMILERGSEYINVALLEDELRIKTARESKEVAPGARKVDPLNNHSLFVKLIQVEFSKQHKAMYLRGIERQLTTYVGAVLDHPKNLGFYLSLNSSKQIKPAQYVDEFSIMAQRSEFAVPSEGKHESFHQKTLNTQIVTKMPAYFEYIARERWQLLMGRLRVSEFCEAKGQIEALVQKTQLLQPDERLSDFVKLHQERIVYTDDAINTFTTQWSELSAVINKANEFKLFTPPIIHALDEQLAALKMSFNNETPMKTTFDRYEKRRVEFTFHMMKWMMDDGRYQVGSIEPATPTSYMRRFLCHLFQIDCPTLLLPDVCLRLDNQLRSLLSKQPSLPIERQFYTWLPHVNLEQQLDSRRLSVTYGKPLTPKIVYECLHYWRAGHELDSIYHALAAIINKIPLVHFDAEFSQQDIRTIKHILKVDDRLNGQFQLWGADPSTSASLALGALLNTRAISVRDYPTDVPVPDERLTIRHLKNLQLLQMGQLTPLHLPQATRDLLGDCKMDQMNFRSRSFFSTDAGMAPLNDTIRIIQKRHEHESKYAVNTLDFTDIQLLKRQLLHYAKVIRKDHNLLNLETISSIDAIYLVLAAMITAHTPEKTSIAELLGVDGSLLKRSRPISEVSFKVNSSIDYFYRNLLREVDRYCLDGEKRAEIKSCIDLISQYGRLNPHTSMAKTLLELDLKFKQTVMRVIATSSLPELFEKMAARGDQPIAVMIDELFKWSETLAPSKHLDQVGGLLMVK